MNFLATNISNFRNIALRVGFTFFIICLYRFAVFVPLPGIDLEVLSSFISKKMDGSLFRIFNSFSGKALEQMSIMSLWLGPYISSSIVIQLLSSSIPRLKELKKDGASGQAKLKQYTRYLTLALAVFQSYSIAFALEYMSDANSSLVMYPGYFFKISTVISMVGSTFLAMWFSEQITSRGIGNGSSILIFVNIISGTFYAFLQLLAGMFYGTSSFWMSIVYIAIVLGLILLIVTLESVIRPVTIQYPNQMNFIAKISKPEIPIKLNVSGVLPPMFAQIFLGFLMLGLNSILSFFGLEYVKGFLSKESLNILLKLFMIVFFAFVYASMVFNPEEVAENLQKSGAYIPGKLPGKKTQQFFESLINRVTFFGAVYLAFISLFPDIVLGRNSQMYVSGTSLLIVVGVTLEFFAHIGSYIASAKLKVGRFKR
ncbi:MAG: preprotein translocase subunit SecY [Alphaproteobacteria bacterium]|nr:MAG: preprotein translocase subunit SecY [Alphaproteobacteria bacterium]